MLTMKRTALQIQSWARQSAEQAIPDDTLMRRFANTRDEAAFAELVRRHGSLVLGVARRVLGDHHAAEDVLQATFLLLARKAAHIQWRRSIAPWLHSVAFRIARTARRRIRHTQSIDEAQALSQVDPLRPLLWDEVRAALDEELEKLPQRLRTPLVLCYLQGRTRDEAARSLGWTLATLKRRLERGRKLLNVRLTRRGLALSAIGAAMLVDSPSLPAAIVDRIVRPILADSVSTSVAALLESQIIASWKKLAIALAMLSAIGLGTGLLAGFTPASPQQPEKEKAESPKPAAKVDLLGDPLPDGAIARLGTTRLRPGQLIQGIAFSPDGKQLAIWAKAWSGGDRDRLIFADPATGKEIKSINLPPCYLHAMRWLKDGRGLAVVKFDESEYFVWEFTDSNSSVPLKENVVLNSMANGDPYGVAISPDGRWLASGGISHDGSAQPIQLREIKSNSRLSNLKSRELGRQPGNGLFVIFSADSKLVFALSRAQEAPKPVPPPPAGPGGIPLPAAMSGKFADRAKLVVYEVQTCKQLKEFDVAPPMHYMQGNMPEPQRLALSPDGKVLWLGDEKGIVHAYDWSKGKELHSFKDPPGNPRPSRSEGISALCPHPDGQTILVADGGTSLTIRDVKSGQVRATVRDDLTSFGHLALSPDGSRIAAADVNVVGQVRLLDAKSGKDLLSRPGHDNMLTGLKVLPGGSALTAGLDRTVRWWDLRTGREVKQTSIGTIRYWSSAFTTDGRGLFGLLDNRVVYVDLATGRQTQVTNEPVKPVSLIHGVSVSTVFVNTANQKVQQWDARTGSVRQTFDLPLPQNGQRDPFAKAIMSPDEKTVAIISTGTVTSGPATWHNGGQISLYDARTAAIRKHWQTGEAVWKCAEFSPDGKYLLVGGNPIMGVPGGPTGSNMPISCKSGLVLLDAKTGDPIRGYEPAVTTSNGYCRAAAVAISPNNQLLAATQHDSSIAVYELATGNLCRHFRGHRNEISQMEFTTDGRRLVSVSQDMTGLVWDVSFAAMAKPSAAGREQLWVDLSKPEWPLAGPALSALANRPDDLLALVREQMKPAERPDFNRDEVARQVEQLDSQVFAIRERTSASLSRLDREALPLLHDHLSKATSRERQTRLQRAIEHIRQSPMPSHHLREMRVIALLEQIGTPATRDDLERLAAGNPEAGLTRTARAALGRIK